MTQEPNRKQTRDLATACSRAVADLRNRAGYGFLSEGAFVERLTAQAAQALRLGQLRLDDTLDDALLRMAKAVYAAALHEGCRSAAADDRTRAYTELSCYLYRIAYHFMRSRGRPAGLAEECTQAALLNISRAVNGIREPGTFLAYAIRAVNHECSRALARQPEDAPLPEEWREGLVALPGPGQALLLDCLLQALARLENQSARMAVVLALFAGFADVDIALLLDTTRSNVGVLRFRALARMREDPLLVDCVGRRAERGPTAPN